MPVADFPDWTNGITLVTAATPMTTDFPDWTEAIAVASGSASVDAMFFTARMLLPHGLFGIWQGQLAGGLPIVTGAPAVEASQSFTSTSPPLARQSSDNVLHLPVLWGFSSQATIWGIDIAASNVSCTEFISCHAAVNGPSAGNTYTTVLADFSVINQLGSNLSLTSGGLVTAITDVFVTYMHVFQGSP